MLRLVNSGTEAAMSAVRLARAFTGRRKLIKFAGAYHGHADALLVEAGSGVATLGIPGTPGITPAAAQDTVVARYNNLSDVESAMARWPRQVAAVIVEPVAGNMGVVPPLAGFLAGLREMTRDSESLLIFDEVITGFRVARGGAQELYGVTPDLTCLGKVLGGGLPIGGYGGRREIMEQVAPAGPVYQAGTLSGNPLAVAAGLATLDALDDSIYRQLESVGARVAAELASAAAAAGVPLTVNRVGSMLTAFFAAGAITEYATPIRPPSAAVPAARPIPTATVARRPITEGSGTATPDGEDSKPIGGGVMKKPGGGVGGTTPGGDVGPKLNEKEPPLPPRMALVWGHSVLTSWSRWVTAGANGTVSSNATPAMTPNRRPAS